MADSVQVTIDGRTLSVPKGTLVVEAARQLGIEIPVYCYHPKLDPVGACRVCAVEVAGQRRPIMTACTTECAEGMVILTRSPAALQAREGILEFLLINHPLDCPVCDRGGECDLQDFTLRYGPGRSRFIEPKRHFPKSVPVGPRVVLDRERCIMCQRCVRFCQEVAIEDGLVIIERGDRSHIGTFEERPYGSEFSGNTVEICPVGALTAPSYRFKARPWELQHHDGVCTSCALGCNLTVDVRVDRVARLRSRTNDAIDDGWLCDRGRYGYLEEGRARILEPMVRRDGELVAVTWEEALSAAAEGFRRLTAGKGPIGLGGVSGPELSNEGAWLLTRFVRGVLQSPHLDHRRGRVAREVAGQPPAWLTSTATVAGIDQAQVLLVAGVCLTERTPVLDLRVKKALRRGARLIVVGEEPTRLDPYAHVRLKGDLSEDLGGLLELMAELRLQPVEAAGGLRHPKPEPWQSGGGASSSLRDAAELLAGAARVTLFYPEEIEDGEALERLVRLAGETGGEAPWGLMALLLGANSRGLREMGVLPDWGPGARRLGQCDLIEAAWGPWARTVGGDYGRLTGPESALAGLLVCCDDPLQARPPGLELLVVADSWWTGTARMADVVLPRATAPEQIMTLTANDGTVQLSRQALAPAGESRADWALLQGLAAAMGQGWGYPDAAAVFAEAGRCNPILRGMSYRSFEIPGQRHWSYPMPGKVGAPRPDLSAIPVASSTAPPVAEAPDIRSAVQGAARVFRGESPPEVPGQPDPRRLAAALSLDRARRSLEAGVAPLAAPGTTQAAQPAGPSPAWRHHHLGVGLHQAPASAQRPADGEGGGEAP